MSGINSMEDRVCAYLTAMIGELADMSAGLDSIQHQGLIGKLKTLRTDIRSIMAPKIRYALLETAVYKSVAYTTNAEEDKIAASQVASRVLELLLNNNKTVEKSHKWKESFCNTEWAPDALVELGLRSLVGLAFFVETTESDDLANWPPNLLEQEVVTTSRSLVPDKEGRRMTEAQRLEAQSKLFKAWQPDLSIENTPTSWEDGLSKVVAAIKAKHGAIFAVDKDSTEGALTLLHKMYGTTGKASGYLLEASKDDCQPSPMKKKQKLERE